MDWGDTAKYFGENSPPGGAVGMNLSQADLDSLARIGKNLGRVSSALEVGVGIYEWQSGQKSFGEAVTEVGGSLAGAWALGKAGVAGGALVGGPAGAFVLGTAGAVVGGIGGKQGAEWVYDYFNGK